MKLPGAYVRPDQMSARRVSADPCRALSEVALARQAAGGDGIAFNWDAYNAKKKEASGSGHKWGQNPTSGQHIREAKPEDVTVSPDGNRVHVKTHDAMGAKTQHEFTKTPNGWQHHSGQPAHAGVQQVLHNLLATHTYTSSK